MWLVMLYMAFDRQLQPNTHRQQQLPAIHISKSTQQQQQQQQQQQGLTCCVC
jgi:hypothetical protein